MKPQTLHLALLAAGMFTAAGSQAQSAYQFIDLGNGTAAGINDKGQIVGASNLGATLWNGADPIALNFGSGGYATAINNAGQIVGATVAHGLPTAVVWNGMTLTSLGASGYGDGITYATCINNIGQVAGGASFGAMSWKGTTPTGLAVNNGFSNVASGINDRGEVVGDAGIYATGDTVATAWNGTTATVLPSLGGNNSYAYAVNNAGEIVGSANIAPNSQTYRATVWQGNTVTILDSLGGSKSFAYAVNNTGEVVGYATNASGANLATLWDGTKAINLNTLLDPNVTQAGWVLTVATGINDQGWIVGDAINARLGEQDAFLLRVSAVPEAEGYLMLLVGLGLIGLMTNFRPKLLRGAAI